MPLVADAYAEIASPMLTCVQKSEGYRYELLVQVGSDEDPITKIRLGPYRFRPEYRPIPMFGGFISRGGPENAFLMHAGSPPGWSRPRWEIAKDEEDEPIYLAWEGRIDRGSTGVFRFLSFFKPGGLRAGLEIHRGKSVQRCGVTGPNYERFEHPSH